MRMFKVLVLTTLVLPLSAQAWDLRVEAPFARGQELSQQSLDTGKGLIFAASHRIVRVGPVLKLEWGVEYSQWAADGVVQGGQAGRHTQDGFGAGVNAQFWVPFTGFAAEVGAIERFQSYRWATGATGQKENLAKPWLRGGLRWNLPVPLPVVNAYVAASYQIRLAGDRTGTADSGQEFKKLWTVGVGVTF